MRLANCTPSPSRLKNVCSLTALLTVLVPLQSISEQLWPSDDMLYRLRESLMKVNTTTRSGGHGFGTAVAISAEKAVTNCHVIANASGVSITKWGSEYAVDAIQSDWAHDLCILTVKYADMKPALLGDSTKLTYEQPLISISMPSDSPAPYTAMTHVKALYPMDNEQVIRTQTAFAIGASGSPVFDFDGRLVGISTFKSPGRNAYYYNMPVNWVKTLLMQPEHALDAQHVLPFWDAPDAQQPFFMQVVLPYQFKQWPTLMGIAQQWLAREPNNVEPQFYMAEAQYHSGQQTEALQQYQAILQRFPDHPATLKSLILHALQTHNDADLIQYQQRLQQSYPTVYAQLQEETPSLGQGASTSVAPPSQ